MTFTWGRLGDLNPGPTHYETAPTHGIAPRDRCVSTTFVTSSDTQTHRATGRKVPDAAGDDATIVRYDGPERFDVLPLLVATDGAVAEFVRDVRRLRPNIVIGGVPGRAESDWEGAQLHVGDAVILLDSLRTRCPMTTVDPDTLERDPEVLRDIAGRFRGRLALNAEVLAPGMISVGDRVAIKLP